MSCLDNVSQCCQCIKPHCIIDFPKRSVLGANIGTGKLFADRNLDVIYQHFKEPVINQNFFGLF